MVRGLYSNKFNCNTVPVVLKKKSKTSRNCYNLGPTCTQRAQCMNGPHAKRKTNFVQKQLISKSSFHFTKISFALTVL